MRLQFNLLQEQQAAWRVSCGTRLVSEACASTPPLRHKGMEGGNSDSPLLVEGGDPAVSPRRFPRALCFTGFSISNNARTPTIFGRKLVNLFLGASDWRATWLECTGGEEPRLFFIRRGEESHSSSFWDCHKGSAWQTVAHHFLKKKRSQMKCTVEVVGEKKALTCCSSVRGPDLAKAWGKLTKAWLCAN